MKTCIAALSIELTASATPATRVRLLPAGEFRSNDGRPKECRTWVMNAACAQRLTEAAANKQIEYSFDYEHQALRTVQNGKPAPASAWFSELEWVEGDGLYATDVRWTPAATQMIANLEYRYVSPVFSYNASTGEVMGLLNVALTNLPALDELDDGVVVAASRLAAMSIIPAEESSMDEEQIAYLLSQLRWILNLPETSTAADIKTELEKIITAISGGQGMAAASVDLLAMLTTAADRDARIAEQEAKIADLSQRVYDPAKFVPVAALSQMQAQYAQTITESGSQEVEQLITAALSDRRLLPGELETWARDLGQKDPAALKAYLEKAPPMAALNRMQTQEVPGATGGTPRSADPRNEGKNPATLDPVLVALSQQFGNDPAEMARLMEE
ncbi:TPA: phage protease [Salmonella enterica subsp. enterica serovar Saintpaul]|nr:phage protease [Salmonella enterica subsp. enterica serovar Saintpaul]